MARGILCDRKKVFAGPGGQFRRLQTSAKFSNLTEL